MIQIVKFPTSQYIGHFKPINSIEMFLNYIWYEKYTFTVLWVYCQILGMVEQHQGGGQ